MFKSIPEFKISAENANEVYRFHAGLIVYNEA